MVALFEGLCSGTLFCVALMFVSESHTTALCTTALYTTALYTTALYTTALYTTCLVSHSLRCILGEARVYFLFKSYAQPLFSPSISMIIGDALSVDSCDYSKQPNGEPVYDNVRLKHYAIMIEELRQYIELKSADDGFKKEYNHIPWGLKFSHDVAKHPDNKLKNRYGNIIACELLFM